MHCPACGQPLPVEPGAACPGCAAAARGGSTDSGRTTAIPAPRDLVDPAASATVIRGECDGRPDAATAPSTVVPGDSPWPPAGSAEAPAGTGFGRYRLLERLGAGGMGVVWRAWDATLRREVALKQLRRDDTGEPDARERFQREARLAAKLRHPRIVPIHDVGEVEGRDYLTMELIEGRTLEAWLAETAEAKRRAEPRGLERLRAEIGILAEVAEAVAFAHGQGVIHRDLKPTNILVDAELRPWVTDFGLAKEVSADPSAAPPSFRTSFGAALGTPQYMSPEQALGDHAGVGPAADVWSLGVILYEILTGETPFGHEAHPWNLLHAVVEQDPVRPKSRNPCVPRELEAIALKALEKAPGRRYGSATEVALELRRWLEGKPVEATHPGLLERLFRHARRHRLAAATGALIVSAGAVAFYFRSVAARERAEARAVREQALTGVRDLARLCVDETLFARRKGDFGAGARFLPHLERAVEAATVRLREPSPEPEYHLGRLLRAMQRRAEARARQEAALAKDPSFAPALYERAVLLATELRERQRWSVQAAQARRGRELRDAGLLSLGGLGGSEPPAAAATATSSVDAEVQECRRRAAEALAALRKRVKEAPTDASAGVGAARLECAEGLLADAQGRGWEAASAALERALAQDPTLEEAYEGLHAAAWEAGRGADALRACDRGIAADAGYLPHRLNRGWALHQRALDRAAKGEDPRADFAAAIADFGVVLAALPDDATARLGRGAALADDAEHAAARGAAADERLAAAVADLERATELRPEVPEAWANLGQARLHRALALAGQGGDATASFATALAAFDRAPALAPAVEWTWRARGVGLAQIGVVESHHGLRPDERYRQAIADFTRALECDPDQAGAWQGRGFVRATWARALQRRGEDAAALAREGVADLERAAARTPDRPDPWVHLGDAHALVGTLVLEAGGDPSAAWDAADHAFVRALELHQDSYAAHHGRAQLGLARGMHVERAGGDPRPIYEAAEADATRAIEARPADATCRLRRGLVRMQAALACRARGGDAEALFDGMESDLSRALELDPKLGAAWTARAYASLNRGPSAADDRARLERACADAARGTERDPNATDAWTASGIARRHRANLAVARGEDVRAELQGALGDFARALELRPGFPRALRERAFVRTNLTLALVQAGNATEADFVAAEADYRAALDREPTDEELPRERGILAMIRGNWLAARGDDPEAHYREAGTLLDAWLARHPADGPALLRRAHLGLSWGQWHKAREQDPEADYRRAEEDAGRSRTAGAPAVSALDVRASVRANWASWRLEHDLDPGTLARDARADFDEAIALAPGRADLLVRRALVGMIERRWEEAVRDFEAAKRLDAASLAPFRALVERARAELQGEKK